MSRKRNQLEKSLGAIVDAVDELRAVLLHYKKANITLIDMVARGEPVIASLEHVDAPSLRPQLTDALDAFAGSRHEARLALLAVALEDGSSISEVGRALSISRQLASRLAAERKQ